MTIPKFRAWTEEGEVMYYDVYPFKDDTLLLSYDEISFDEVPASDFVLMSSTGLFDVNGEEVFESDIVKLCFEEDGLFEICLDTVGGFYTKNVLTEKIRFLEASDFDELETVKEVFNEYVEIVGNIYENPV